jgi:DNA-binding response OmpR family regulator
MPTQSKGLLQRIDDLVLSCKLCNGTGYWQQQQHAACPLCMLARQIRDEVYRSTTQELAVTISQKTVGNLVAWVDGNLEPIQLSQRLTGGERHALVTLVRASPQAVRYAMLFRNLQDNDREAPHMARMVVARIRPKIQDCTAKIVTVHGFGYRIVEQPV